EAPPDLNLEELAPPEIFLTEQQKTSKFKDEPENESSIKNRFKIISILLSVVLIVGLFVFETDTKLFFYVCLTAGLGSWVWFFSDYKMMRVNKFFNLSLAVAIVIFLYGYYIQKKNLLYSFSYYYSFFTSAPLIVVLIQKPLRLLFKKIFNREPVIEKPTPSAADFFYTILLLVVPLLLVMLVPFLNNRPKTIYGIP